MEKLFIKCRGKIDTFFKPFVWWAIWLFGALYFSYVLIFKVVLLLRENYELISRIFLKDPYLGKLFLFLSYIPLISFTCLLTAHLLLAVNKLTKFKKVLT